MKFIIDADNDTIKSQHENSIFSYMLCLMMPVMGGLLLFDIFMLPDIASGASWSFWVQKGLGCFLVVAAPSQVIPFTGIIINRPKMRHLRWYGIGRPILSKTQNITGYSRIILHKKYDGTTQETHFIALSNKSGNKRFNIGCIFSSYADAKKNCEILSKFLNLPMVDNTADTEHLRDADKLNWNLTDFIKHGNMPAHASKRPFDSKVKSIQDKHLLSLELPQSGIKLWDKFLVSIPGILVLLLSISIIFIQPKTMRSGNIGYLIALDSLVLGLCAYLFYRFLRFFKEARHKETVMIDGSNLIVNMWNETRKMSLSKIEELVIEGDGTNDSVSGYGNASIFDRFKKFEIKTGMRDALGIVVRSNQDYFIFGRSLNFQDKCYVQSLILETISKNR